MRKTILIPVALSLFGVSCGGTTPRITEPRAESTAPALRAEPSSATTEPTEPTERNGAERTTTEPTQRRASTETGRTRETPASAEAEALATAFEARLTVYRRHDGTPVLAPRCRNAPVPCEDRLLAFAELIVEIARDHGVDPLLVGAMALRESGLDPSALGRRREAGIIQLHPRGAGHDVRFVRDAAYRARCQARVDACQREVLERGISTLARGFERCGGLRGGLGAYASGHCTTRVRYIDRVLEERTRLRSLVRRRRARD